MAKNIKSTVNIDKLLFKKNIADEQKTKWESKLNKCYSYIYPDHYAFGTDNKDKNVVSKAVYDSTAMLAINDASNQLQEALFQKKTQWFDLEYINDDLDVDDENFVESKKELDKMAQLVARYFSRSKNANRVINSAIKKLLISTCAIYIDEGTRTNPFSFIDVSLRDLSFTTNAENDIKDVFYTKYMSLEEIKLTYDYEASRFFDDRNKNVKVVLCYTKEENNKEEYTELNVVLEDSKNNKEVVIIHTEYFGVSPWIIARWAINDNNHYGTGIVLEMIEDIELLNKISKFKRASINTEYAGTYLRRPANIVTSQDLKNHCSYYEVIRNTNETVSVIDVKDNASEGHRSLNDIIAPIPPSFYPIDDMLKAEEIRQRLQHAFMFQPLGDINRTGGQFTAYEVAQRIQIYLTSRSGTILRLMSDLLQPMVERMIYIMNAFDDNNNVERIKRAIDIKKNIHITFKSQVNKIDNLEQLSSIMQFLQITSQVLPQQITTTSINYDKLLKKIVLLLNINADILLTEEEKEEMMKQAQEMAQQQAQAMAQARVKQQPQQEAEPQQTDNTGSDTPPQ